MDSEMAEPPISHCIQNPTSHVNASLITFDRFKPSSPRLDVLPLALYLPRYELLVLIERRFYLLISPLPAVHLKLAPSFQPVYLLIKYLPRHFLPLINLPILVNHLIYLCKLLSKLLPSLGPYPGDHVVKVVL